MEIRYVCLQRLRRMLQQFKKYMFLQTKMSLTITIKATKITVFNLVRLFLFLLVVSEICIFSISGLNFTGLPNFDEKVVIPLELTLLLEIYDSQKCPNQRFLSQLTDKSNSSVAIGCCYTILQKMEVRISMNLHKELLMEK